MTRKVTDNRPLLKGCSDSMIFFFLSSFIPFLRFLYLYFGFFFFRSIFFLPVLSYDLKREDGQGKIPCLCQKRRTSPVGLMEEGTSLMFDDLGFLFFFLLGKSLGTAIKLLYDTLHALHGIFFCRLFLRGDGAIDVFLYHLLVLPPSPSSWRHLIWNRGSLVVVVVFGLSSGGSFFLFN